jgi:glucose-1-phosphate adenylyltransferase
MITTDLLRGTLTMILAGGQGERLYPLTKDRSKPSVPFGGQYRIIDFTLSNCVNSGLRSIYVLTQYKSASLMRHIKLGWNIFSSELGEFIYTIPPQLRVGAKWYEGTADALYQNVYTLQIERPDRVLILSGDHIYRMDYRPMIQAHVASGATLTIAAALADASESSRFGVLETDAERRVVGFEEKPARPCAVPDAEGRLMVSMGVYIFDTEVLVRAVSEDAKRKSHHDFGRDIIPSLIGSGKVFAYPFLDEKGAPGYWRDIGTLDSYYEANMDLVAVSPVFNLYEAAMPLRTHPRPLPPAKTVFAQEYPGGRIGLILDSLICGGTIVSGGRVERSVLGTFVRVNSYAQVEDSILMDRVVVGRRARIRRAIIDKDVHVPEGFTIGFDREADAKRFVLTEGGIAVIPKGANLDDL